MSSTTGDSTVGMPTSLLKSQRFEDRLCGIRTAFEKVEAFLDDPDSPGEPLTEEEIHSISLSYRCLVTALRTHLDRLHTYILTPGNPSFSLTENLTNLDHHWVASKALSCMQEITFLLGISKKEPRKYEKPKPISEYPAARYLAVLRLNAWTAFHNLHLIEKNMQEADSKIEGSALRAATRKCWFALHHSVLIQGSYMAAESVALLNHIGLDGIIKDFVTIDSNTVTSEPAVVSELEPTAKPEEEERPTCFICWSDCSELPVWQEPIELPEYARAAPAEVDETGPDAMIRVPCCNGGYFHRKCLIRAFKPPHPICPHCQQLFPDAFCVELCEWQCRDISRQTHMVRELMLEEQSRNLCA
ncbi:hypothetical protein H2200_010365 [Cladophialophora chaetospira]|uniref:Uncharacterized protein n=1 Tax=Cladophialophora chaetospira TaxID=386627 RepID=A0AA38X1C3_9EURO|nr:hypothetical protein H2200_010365 [Cladophialophora chaetospira]